MKNSEIFSAASEPVVIGQHAWSSSGWVVALPMWTRDDALFLTSIFSFFNKGPNTEDGTQLGDLIVRGTMCSGKV